VSEEDVDVVRDQFAAVNERDFERAMGHYADDVVLDVSRDFGANWGTYEGKEAVGNWFGDWFQVFGRDYRFEIDEARPIGERIFIHATHGGHGRTSGAEVRAETSYLYRVRNGKIVSVEIHGRREAALAAAGTAE
jgi:ketosteroid isomerase-like protein